MMIWYMHIISTRIPYESHIYMVLFSPLHTMINTILIYWSNYLFTQSTWYTRSTCIPHQFGWNGVNFMLIPCYVHWIQCRFHVDFSFMWALCVVQLYEFIVYNKLFKIMSFCLNETTYHDHKWCFNFKYFSSNLLSYLGSITQWHGGWQV